MIQSRLAFNPHFAVGFVIRISTGKSGFIHQSWSHT